jgi:hypothetical protein
MASQQVERTAELQDPEVRAELDSRVRKCVRGRSADGRLGSVPQARAYAGQQTTLKQAGGQWCESGTRTARGGLQPGAAALRMAAQACRPCFSSTRA